MKKIFSGIALLAMLQQTGQAQISTGGLPLGMQAGRQADYIPLTTAGLPDWDSGLKSWEASPGPKPYLVALMSATDLGFPNSGITRSLGNGTRIWQAQLKIADAKAIGLYYDAFHLPQGVKLYISNANGRQVLGAYTTDNNDASGKFANEAVEGSVVTLELDIEPGVNLSDIRLHIDRAAVYSRSIEYLGIYQDLQPIDVWDSQLTGGSSVCMINAVCPLGSAYTVQRNAAFQTLIPVGGGIGACSATMVNTTTNAPGACKQYFLLASHCEFSNATTDAGFSQFILRFNYQHSICNPAAAAIPNTQQSLTGAKFVARSVLPVDGSGNPIANQIKGDFLLLELKSSLPDSWGMNLAGWNNDANIPTTNTAPKKFIGFHHPGGDVKKVSSSHMIQSQNLGASNTHWQMTLDSGLVAEGSSGSALFDGDGRMIGIASVAAVGQGVPSSCALNVKGENVLSTTAKTVFYSKFSYDWDYSADGSANNRKLKPWLNPNNSTVTTVDAVKSNCSAIGGTGVTNYNKLDEGVIVYPNPSGTGRVMVKINLAEAADLNLEVYDIAGKKVNTFQLPHTSTGSFALDLSGNSNGVYLLKLSDGHNTISRKIMLAR